MISHRLHINKAGKDGKVLLSRLDGKNVPVNTHNLDNRTLGYIFAGSRTRLPAVPVYHHSAAGIPPWNSLGNRHHPADKCGNTAWTPSVPVPEILYCKRAYQQESQKSHNCKPEQLEFEPSPAGRGDGCGYTAEAKTYNRKSIGKNFNDNKYKGDDSPDMPDFHKQFFLESVQFNQIPA